MGDLSVCPVGWAGVGAGAPPTACPGSPPGIGCNEGEAMIIGVGPATWRLMRTFSSPSVISISPIPDSWTRSFSFRRSIASLRSTRLLVHGPHCRLQRQFVHDGSEAGDDARGQIREVRMVAERLACVDVGQVYFDERHLHGCQRVAQRDARMRE